MVRAQNVPICSERLLTLAAVVWVNAQVGITPGFPTVLKNKAELQQPSKVALGVQKNSPKEGWGTTSECR